MEEEGEDEDIQELPQEEPRLPMLPPIQPNVAPLHMSGELVRGLAAATVNVAMGMTLSVGGAQHSTPGQGPPMAPATASSHPGTQAAGAGGAGRGPTVTVASSTASQQGGLPYLQWVPSQAQLMDAHHLLCGTGPYDTRGFVTVLPKWDPRRSGNRKWQCTWPMCNRGPMSSQGECRAHVLSHRTVRSSPICTCAKATFANAKTLATHLRHIHNVDLDELHRAPPSNVIEDPVRPLRH